ncbi:MAG: LacI family DNA-binding transcriptional regulator [Oscillospiraceae bacterium]
MSIKEIAEKVGVSVSTVSRVLSKPDYRCSSKELREQIFAAAREMNYVPNESAKNLRSGENKRSAPFRLCILVTRTDNSDTDPFFNELIGLIRTEINKNMCMLMRIWYRPDFSDEGKCSALNIKQAVKELYSEESTDGMIIVGKCCPQVIKQLKIQWKNIVSVNRNSTNYEVDEVLCDGRKIASSAVEHLIRLGHRKIAYVGECHNESRFKGFQETLLKYNIDTDIDHIIQTNISENGGYSAMEKIIQMQNRPTGIYCANDIIAIGMLKALSRYNNRYYNPSIISSDDIAEARYTKPMLTTISLPKEEMAKFTVYLLLDRLNGGHKSVARMELESSLVARSSCSPMKNMDMIEYYI